ncbi:MAG: hypothetical protein AAGE52_39855 [Myxococcota bacterium]
MAKGRPSLIWISALALTGCLNEPPDRGIESYFGEEASPCEVALASRSDRSGYRVDSLGDYELARDTHRERIELRTVRWSDGSGPQGSSLMTAVLVAVSHRGTTCLRTWNWANYFTFRGIQIVGPIEFADRSLLVLNANEARFGERYTAVHLLYLDEAHQPQLHLADPCTAGPVARVNGGFEIAGNPATITFAGTVPTLDGEAALRCPPYVERHMH